MSCSYYRRGTRFIAIGVSSVTGGILDYGYHSFSLTQALPVPKLKPKAIHYGPQPRKRGKGKRRREWDR